MKPIPHNWKEARRLRAWHLKQQGWPQRHIAEALGVTEGAVSQWMTRARQGGPKALRSCPPPGAPRRLTGDQLAQLPALLHRGPEAHGFRGQLWTRGRVAAVIQLTFGVSYHPRHVGRLCQVIRWSPQRQGVELRNRCGGNLPQLRRERRAAVKRVRRKPRLITSVLRKTLDFYDQVRKSPFPIIRRFPSREKCLDKAHPSPASAWPCRMPGVCYTTA